MVETTLTQAKYFRYVFEERFGLPTHTQEEPLSDACLAGKPRTEDLPNPYQRNWSWLDPHSHEQVAHVLAAFNCEETDRGVYLFVEDADGLRVRVAKP